MSARVTPFDVYCIGVRLAAIDVGFSLRADGHIVELPPDTTIASYDDHARAERRGDSPDVVEGTAEGILRVLRAAGYRARIARPR